MKVLIVLVVMVGFLYGIDSKTLVTENEMLNESEDGIAADIEKMPAEGFEETEKQLQQAPLDEEEPTDEVEQEELTDEAEQEEEVTANGCVVTARVCGLFYKPKWCKARQCFTVRAAATRPVYKKICKYHKFDYKKHACSKRQCFKVQVGVEVVYVKARKCWRYTKFCGFKCVRKCKTITFRYPSPPPAEVAQN
ncbi:PREDICTED: uncharacterized protein LOC100634443 [Amphimedon queenslandica]|uniref:Uncharacterized protein n=1 Tax=Amphimedon queenslandica TaxID=400682 RepID=A0AAN0INH7_AMPQE|nr:PREDICTED: uncharacterized protein LOC100634443 [Amphimedon queenslandica]|eukprot:XP_011404709.2 PREDICTED: uncharacterized protein LOC100634443 [Amphimedon queenslandica]